MCRGAALGASARISVKSRALVLRQSWTAGLQDVSGTHVGVPQQILNLSIQVRDNTRLYLSVWLAKR